MNRVLVLLSILLSPGLLPAVDRKDLKPGLLATYTAQPSASTATSTQRLEPGVGFTLEPGESAHPNLGSISSIRWNGYIQIVTPGSYQFTPVLEGGSVTIQIDRKSITPGAETLLPPGVLPVQIEYTAKGNGRQRLELQWQGPGFKREPVPYFFFGHIPGERPATFATDLQRDAGRYLFEELACIRCHAAPKGETVTSLVERSGPDLSEIGKRVYAGWLDAWLEDPTAVRKDTTMPRMFTDDAEGRAERTAVVKYLTSLGGPMPESRAPSFSNEYTRTIANGQRLFTAVGCAACHGAKLAATNKLTEDDDPKAVAPARDRSLGFYGLGTLSGEQATYDLGAIGSKTRPEEVAKYLQDPKKLNSHGRMPALQLNGDEARDLSRYLCRKQSDKFDRLNPKGTTLLPSDMMKTLVPDAEKNVFEKLKDEDKWIDLGKRIVLNKGCVNCHTLAPKNKAEITKLVAPDSRKIATSTAGCLGEKPDARKLPVYKLDAQDRQALATFLKADLHVKGLPSPIFATRAAIKRFNCLNCHSREGEGGIGTELAEQMKALERGENADNELAPPRLSGVGHKVQVSWLKSVLLEGGRARPWMSLRMPQYGAENVGQLVESLAKCEGVVAETEKKSAELVSAQIEAGRKLTGKEGLGCIACHDINGVVGGGTRGPDLALNSQRIRKEWYSRWMHNPQRIAPGTRMPQNFNDGKSVIPTILNGDADAQIDAIWAYLALGPGLPLPAGIEPPKGLIIAVGKQPELLRTFMPDSGGSKAIAVGYPGGVNIAFDAHAARLSYAWEGNFLDAAPVWNNRGGSPAKLLGPKFLTPPAGNPWGVSTGKSPPDYVKRADDYAWGKFVPNDNIFLGRMNVRFLGYGFDSAGVPSFRYQIGESDSEMMTISETATPAKAAIAAGLARKFVVELPGKDKVVWFLAAQGNAEPRFYGPSGSKLEGTETPAIGSRAVVPEGGRAQVLSLTSGPAGTSWVSVKSGSSWQLLLRLPEGDSPRTAELNLTQWMLPRDDEGLIKSLPK